ncbi:hypothetical protein CMV_027661 [Castanea mollissima]|uniref:Myosin motor domain-containing protein n=1 Tax=Castanea mollissima TaxID=60419 RepID=A0A8J4Q9D9_9ROSI|nr:hypothetical protein CMV_027661 [Castanea mollissima]
MSIGSDQFAEFYGSDRFAGFCGSDRREVCGRRCLFRRRIALLMLLLLRSSQVPDLDIRTRTRESREEAIFRVVAAVLHLGNINFPKGKEIDSSVIKDEKSRFHLNMTAELLRCDAQSLEDALIKLVMVTPEEIITRTLDPENAIASRDAIAKKQEVECIVKQ